MPRRKNELEEPGDSIYGDSCSGGAMILWAMKRLISVVDDEEPPDFITDSVGFFCAIIVAVWAMLVTYGLWDYNPNTNGKEEQ